MEFETGIVPEQRAAIDGSLSALQDPGLVSLNTKSLFASLIQIRNIWSAVALRAMSHNRHSRPSHGESDFAKLNSQLEEWDRSLPWDYAFGNVPVGERQRVGEDLVCSFQIALLPLLSILTAQAFFEVNMCFRLCHLVLRKVHIEE
jgi:hypothetical protein